MLKIFEFLFNCNCESIINIEEDDDSDYLSKLTNEEKRLGKFKKKKKKIKI